MNCLQIYTNYNTENQAASYVERDLHLYMISISPVLEDAELSRFCRQTSLKFIGEVPSPNVVHQTGFVDVVGDISFSVVAPAVIGLVEESLQILREDTMLGDNLVEVVASMNPVS